MKTIDKPCPEKYKSVIDYQGCSYCGGQLIKEMTMPFQLQAYYRCSWCNTKLPLRIFNELKEAQ